MEEIKDKKVAGLGLTPAVKDAIPAFVPGKDGKAIQLEPPTYLDYGNYRSRCFGNFDKCGNGWSTVMWVFVTSTDGSYPENILSSGGRTNGANVGISLQYFKDGYIKCTLKTSTFVYIGNVKMALKIWYHIAVTWSPKFGLAIFRNGKLASEVKTGTFKSVVPDSYPNFIIGTRNDKVNNDSDYYGKCLIDDLIIWEKRLPPGKISEIYYTPNYNVTNVN
jgi:hypothetical protein